MKNMDSTHLDTVTFDGELCPVQGCHSRMMIRLELKLVLTIPTILQRVSNWLATLGREYGKWQIKDARKRRRVQNVGVAEKAQQEERSDVLDEGIL